MIETNLQEALAKITLDEDYRNKIVNNPDQILKDYGIVTQEALPTQNGDSMMINESFRPVANCCCCYPA